MYKNRIFFMVGFLLVLFCSSVASGAKIDWKISQSLQTADKPVDVLVSSNGRYTFILTEEGSVHIYSADGVLQDSIKPNVPIDSMETSPDGERLFLLDKLNSLVRVVDLEFIQEFKIDDSPFRGPAEAPVVLAVFSDFQ